MFKVIPLIFTTNISAFAIEDSLKIHQLDEVKIEARRKQQERSLSPVQMLDSLTLKRISADNVAEALRVATGVVVKDYGGIGGLKTISIRSLGAEHTMVQIDGIAITNVQTGQIDLGKLPLINVAEIELYKGQANELPQTARAFAFASLINIKSKSANEILIQPLQVLASMEFGSFGLLRPALAVTKKLDDKSSIALNTELVSANGQYAYALNNQQGNEFAIRDNADITTYKLEADYVYRFSNKSNLKVKGYYYDSERGLPGAVILYNAFAAQRLWNKDYFLQARYKSAINENWTLLANAKYTGNYLRYLDTNVLTISGVQDDNFYQNEYYASLGTAFQANNNLKLSVVSDVFLNTLRANLPLFAYPQRLTWLTAFVAKYTFKKLLFEGNLLTSIIDEKVEFGNSAKNKKIITPYLAMGYKPFYKLNLRLRAFAKRNFRMPSFNDLYFYRVGNPNLRPEFANQYNLGLYYAKKDWLFFEDISLNMDVFKIFVKDKIVAVPTQNLFVWSIQNVGIVNTTGGEFSVNFLFKPYKKYQLSGYWTYTIQKALDKTDVNSPTYNQQIAYTPFETLSSGLSLKREQFTINWNILFSGFRYVLGENIYANLLPYWSTQDISLAYNFKMKKIGLLIKATFNNIFDTRYEVIRSFPLPGRNFRFSIGFRF